MRSALTRVPVLVLAVVLCGGCAPQVGRDEVAVLSPEAPPAAAVRAVPAPAEPEPVPAPGAIPSREARPRCVRLGDDSGWTCSPAATSPEELARLVAEAEASRTLPDYRTEVSVSDVARAPSAGAAGIAFLQLADQDDFGGIRSYVALAGPAGWGFAADAGMAMFGVNGDGNAQLLDARRDASSGLVVVSTAWHGSDAACTEPLSWTFDERRVTVCDPTRLLCRTVPIERTTFESRWHEQTDTTTRRRLPESFRARLALQEGARVALHPERGRLPRAVRAAARTTALGGLPVQVEPFRN